MLDRIPHLKMFSNLYWHQMGDEVYGTIDIAFRQFLADAARLPDGGASMRRSLYGELILLLDNPDYADWLRTAIYDPETSRAIGGQFITPKDIKPLLLILDESIEPDS